MLFWIILSLALIQLPFTILIIVVLFMKDEDLLGYAPAPDRALTMFGDV